MTERPAYPDDSTTAAAGGNRSVLLVQPEPALPQLLLEELARRDGPPVVAAMSAFEAARQLRTTSFIALVVDADLSDLDASGLLRTWRGAPRRGPVLLLRSVAEEPPAGSEAVLIKPIRLGSLVSWIIAAGQPSDGIRLGRFRLDRALRALIDDDSGASIRLTEKEVAVLSHLAQAGGEIVSREALLGHVWRYAAGANTNTVATHVYRLRRKLAKDGALSVTLVTEPGGYRLAVDR